MICAAMGLLLNFQIDVKNLNDHGHDVIVFGWFK